MLAFVVWFSLFSTSQETVQEERLTK